MVLLTGEMLADLIQIQDLLSKYKNQIAFVSEDKDFKGCYGLNFTIRTHDPPGVILNLKKIE